MKIDEIISQKMTSTLVETQAQVPDIHFTSYKPQQIRILALIVISGGGLVMGGWLFHIPVLTYIIPGAVTMKFLTALSFVCSGLVIYLIGESFSSKRDLAQVFLPIPILILVIIFGTVLTSIIFGLRTGIEDLFSQENLKPSSTFVPGRPSLMTLFNFWLIATAGLLVLFNPRRILSYLKKIGILITFISVTAIIGYLLRVPAMYYLIPNVSTGMAIHTSILFLIAGISFMLLSREDSSTKD
jgi:hypothetical protein